MKFDSPLFDRIRVKPGEERTRRPDASCCQWKGCGNTATHRAPKGRQHENEYWRFCLAHVLQAEPPILVLRHSPLRRAVRRRVAAALPLTARLVRPARAVLVGLDPNAVEQGRVEFHDRTLCESGNDTFKS